jgi:hypothetical protein
VCSGSLPTEAMIGPARRDRNPFLLRASIVSVAVGLATAGGWVWTAETEARNVIVATITLVHPAYSSLVCIPTTGTSGGTIYFLVTFEVANVSAPVRTDQFGLLLLSQSDQAIAADGPAPAPNYLLPCGAAPPQGWYAMLVPPHGTVATYPTYDARALSGGNIPFWSNASQAPMRVPLGGWLVLITNGDRTGSGDHLASFGVDGSTVTLAGSTTLPGFSNP